MGGPSLPQKHLLCDLLLPVFAAVGPESGCSAGGSLPGAQSPRAAALCHPCVQERHGWSAVAATASTWVSFVLFLMPGFSLWLS